MELNNYEFGEKEKKKENISHVTNEHAWLPGFKIN